jgi:hypothetical protein
MIVERNEAVSKRRIHLLGGLQVFSGPDRATAIPARKAQALLAYLARHPGRPKSRTRRRSGSGIPERR